MDLIARQEIRRLLMQGEGTMGTHSLEASTRLPARAESRLAIESERVNVDGALDGYAGGIMEVPTRKHWSGEIVTTIPDHGEQWCGLLAQMLLASGFAATYDGDEKDLTLTPSTLPAANWPGVGSPGARSPMLVSLGDVRIDNHAADSVGRVTSATFASKLRLMRGEPMTLVSSVLGLVSAAGEREYIADLSALGALPTGETTYGVPFAPSVLTVSRVTDEGSGEIVLTDFDGLELDFAPAHELLAGGAYGYAAAPVMYTGPMTASLAVALSRANDINLLDRTRLSFQIEQTFGSGAKLEITIPCAELGQGVPSNDGGKIMMTFPLRLVRSAFGVATSPITIVLHHA